MDAFYQRLLVRAATIDELLSDQFESLPGQKGDAELAARRLAAWCRSSASGDWSLFARRLSRDGLAIDRVLTRFATVRRRPSAILPLWIDDAIWIETALRTASASATPIDAPEQSEACAFEDLLVPVVDQAEARLQSAVGASPFENLNESARTCLRRSLLRELADLSAPALYERFDKARKGGGASLDAPGSRYQRFVAEMRGGGFRRLFDDKPVLLRLIACITRQWIDTSREFVLSLEADLAAIRRDILRSGANGRVSRIESDLSDPHNGGRSVKIVTFEDGSRIVYKPKDLRPDVALHGLVEQLNGAEPPIELKAMRAVARKDCGWTEFIEHAGCADQEGCDRFFRRAGAWLALLHCLAATDMHQENMIAIGDHPVPIDLETILQAVPEENKSQDPEAAAFDAAGEIVLNSVMMVGLLPAYGRSPENKVFAIGGMTSGSNSKIELKWTDINSDEMRPAKPTRGEKTTSNLPHIDGRYARFGDHIGSFLSGFEDYANFLRHRAKDANPQGLFGDFAGLSVRRVVRPTQFYYLLLQRLKNHRTMEDGVIWSAQADFTARLGEWDQDSDVVWPLQRAERAALIALNVPYFMSPTDGNEIRDATGCSVRTHAPSGLDRARVRLAGFNAREIAWQIEVIRENTGSISRSNRRRASGAEWQAAPNARLAVAPPKEVLVAEADRIAGELVGNAIRRGRSAAWIGLDWLGDGEVSQLVRLGPELYNGACGIAVFLAAHSATTGSGPSGELALAGIAHLRTNLRSRNAARLARALGVGGATGLGSIVYGLTVISKCLRDDDLLTDARRAAELFTDDLIAADKQFDAIGGSAGAILGLLRLYRDAQSEDVIGRATKCGEHLLSQSRVGPPGRRSWVGQGFGPQALNGMSHGAAGFAYALASLAAATGREDFAQAASECIAFEDSSYDAGHNNWPDLRGGERSWPCQWCHGAPGIGLARIATIKRGTIDAELLGTDIRHAVDGVERSWPGPLDTLCCGTLGSIEFICEAGRALCRSDLRELASRRLAEVVQNAAAAGDYRWNSGKGRFNLGLFRGLAGVGYTLLRRLETSLPNVLIWE